MSQIAVAGFLTQIANDPNRVRELAEAVKGRPASEAGEAMALSGAASGFTFSGEEALAVCQQFTALSARLQDDDAEVLGGVRGGTGIAGAGIAGASSPSANPSFSSMTPEMMDALFSQVTDKGGDGPAIEPLTPPDNYSAEEMERFNQMINEMQELLQNIQNAMQENMQNMQGMLRP